MAQSSSSAQDFAKFLLRVALGVLILLHGVNKLVNGLGPINNMVTGAGLPQFVAYGVLIGEVLAPILVIIGVWTRPAALIIAINMVVAIGLAHTKQLFGLTGQGGWALELQGMYLISALVVSLLGAGRYSLGGAAGRMN